MRYEITPQAKAQIEAIVIYTDAWFGEQQSAIYVGGLYDSFERIAENPRFGRKWRSGRYRYIYRGHHVYYRLGGTDEDGRDIPLITRVASSIRVREEL